jgi:predicted glycoside hydrolase/deacetylase ChbG (UPF0249 family)
VRGLLDPDGYMWRSEVQTAMKATPAEVEIELRAQIDKALAAGLKPTHLDTHMGTLYTRRDFFDVYTRLGREYGIPVMAMRPTPEALAYAKSLAFQSARKPSHSLKRMVSCSSTTSIPVSRAGTSPSGKRPTSSSFATSNQV